MLLLLYRAAQKLNLSSKRKKYHPPLPHTHDFSIYATNFSGILQLCPPPAPPCLLRAVSKIKDNPGIGKVTLDFIFFKIGVQINCNGAGSFQPRTRLDRLKGMVLDERGTPACLNMPESCYHLLTLENVCSLRAGSEHKFWLC